jgi:hypothetical protein
MVCADESAKCMDEPPGLLRRGIEKIANFAPMKKSLPILLQIAVWVAIWSVFAFTGNTSEHLPGYYMVITVRVLVLALFYNLAYYLLLPLYFSDKKRLFYLLLPLFFVGYVGFSVGVDLTLAKPEKMFANAEKRGHSSKNRSWSWLLIPPVFFSTAIFGAAAGFRGVLEFENKKMAEEEANRRRLEAEIALLKSQINPHFLLNTLNNLYGIAVTEPDKAPEALLKLSDMVRYILYDCAQPVVPISQELDFIKNYISLQQLRLPPNVSLRVDIPERDPDGAIEPMILIPFVENAFKHGLTTRKPCEIVVVVGAENNRLNLRVENEVFAHQENRQGNESGIGLANVMQRLEHAYVGQYKLSIAETNGRHSVFLDLQLGAA